MTLTDFLLARIAEDEAAAQAARPSIPWDELAFHDLAADDVPHIARHSPARVLAECAAKRKIVEFHEAWPVLVERPTGFDPSFGADRAFVDQMVYRASTQIAWMTQQEYRNRFGDEPPTAPMLAALAAIWADRPDYRPEEWA